MKGILFLGAGLGLYIALRILKGFKVKYTFHILIGIYETIEQKFVRLKFKS
ncbi:hypothetical protein NARC_10290 [Candidatus Nitrosocosmicus arcticus]|uniref:Uncharacterized protein n=1 Tax=Candidatus Nitrosocosmicus arcticus TaxID=2035267 RepID=A0A557SZ50_9ARCH|nr:hypothetical protein NARC_10290 [Candidatus Nitrosocosmicus arcticus]